MKNREIKELTTKELKEKIEDENSHCVKLKINHTVSPLENNQVIKHTRRLVARLKTELRRRELSGEL